MQCIPEILESQIFLVLPSLPSLQTLLEDLLLLRPQTNQPAQRDQWHLEVPQDPAVLHLPEQTREFFTLSIFVLRGYLY